MIKHHITGNTSLPMNIKGSGNVWILDTSASIITVSAFHETALSEAKGAHDNTILIKGAVVGGAAGDDDAIVLAGRGTHLVVGDLGVVQGDTGIHASGRSQEIVSHGAITALGTGMFADHGGTMMNDGSIDAGVGIWSNSGNSRIVNGKGGVITAGDTAIEVQGVDAASRIINRGTIEAYYYAVDGGEMADIITNRGTMKGVLSLGAGNDVFDNRGGTIDHEVSTDSGNDTLITDDANVKMAEQLHGGKDTVRSTVDYTLNDNVENLMLIGKALGGATGNELNNHLDGNSALNVMFGLAGKDRLDGHGGNDILTGGSEADTFVFGNGYGTDAVTDFEKGIDRIDLRDWDAISSFADVKALAHETSVYLALHVGKDVLRLDGIELADLHASDFQF